MSNLAKLAKEGFALDADSALRVASASRDTLDPIMFANAVTKAVENATARLEVVVVDNATNEAVYTVQLNYLGAFLTEEERLKVTRALLSNLAINAVSEASGAIEREVGND